MRPIGYEEEDNWLLIIRRNNYEQLLMFRTFRFYKLDISIFSRFGRD